MNSGVIEELDKSVEVLLKNNKINVKAIWVALEHHTVGSSWHAHALCSLQVRKGYCKAQLLGILISVSTTTSYLGPSPGPISALYFLHLTPAKEIKRNLILTNWWVWHANSVLSIAHLSSLQLSYCRHSLSFANIIATAT